MGPALDSASGLRPLSAFLVVALVLALVAGRVGQRALAAEEAARPRMLEERDPDPEYRIVDRQGRQMALFVQRLDLELSPNALVQGHTPGRIARRISAALGGRPDPAEVLARLLPDARAGVVTARLELDRQQAERVDLWARQGSLDGGGAGPIEGFWLERAPGERYLLVWRPELALSEGQRAVHLPNNRSNPLRWSRFLADGLAACLWGEPPRGPVGPDAQAVRARRDAVWKALMPTSWTVALRDLDARCAPALAAVLTEERIAAHQMRIARGRNRRYPAGTTPLLGRWGYIDGERALAQAARELGLELEAPELEGGLERALQALAPDDRAALEGRAAELVAEPHPLSGLERACDRLLGQERWSFLRGAGARYLFERHRPVHERARGYFRASVDGRLPPSVFTTFDVLLQRQVGVELEKLVEKHRPALAMAIVVDVESGDVLALDSRDLYHMQGYPPLYHEFTPGSTAKVLVMATALEAGVVRPEERFNVGYGGECVVHGRVIHEAEHSREGILTAAETLAHSLNAGLAQIGTRVPDVVLRGTLQELGYGRDPQTGLSGERPGYLTPLPWKRAQTHTSVAFGHEMLVTFWQHAAGLATVLRGGEARPLRLLDAIEQDGRRWPQPYEEPRRVLSEATCETVRDMMRLGAREGTGASAATPGLVEGLDVGTKTGTAQKVSTELCVHVELADQERHHREGTRCSRACRRALHGVKPPHRSCYTSSMVAFGRRLDGNGRELMVLVVVDEPRGREKYGSRVAGPTAIAILREALGVTTFGEEPVEPIAGGFLPSPIEPPPGSEQPWAEAAR